MELGMSELAGIMCMGAAIGWLLSSLLVWFIVKLG